MESGNLFEAGLSFAAFLSKFTWRRAGKKRKHVPCWAPLLLLLWTWFCFIYSMSVTLSYITMHEAGAAIINKNQELPQGKIQGKIQNKDQGNFARCW